MAENGIAYICHFKSYKYDFKLHQTGFQSAQMLKRNQDSVDLYFEMCELAPSSTANQFLNPYPSHPVYDILL